MYFSQSAMQLGQKFKKYYEYLVHGLLNNYKKMYVLSKEIVSCLFLFKGFWMTQKEASPCFYASADLDEDKTI